MIRCQIFGIRGWSDDFVCTEELRLPIRTVVQILANVYCTQCTEEVEIKYFG